MLRPHPNTRDGSGWMTHAARCARAGGLTSFMSLKNAELTQQLEGQRRSSRPSTARRETRTGSGSGAGSSHKGARVLPSTLILRPALPPANVQRARTAIPRGIHEAPLLCMHDPHSTTCQVQVLERFGCRQFTALNLLSARFFVEKAFFDWYHTLLSSAAISKGCTKRPGEPFGEEWPKAGKVVQ
jgi:hypothetical protein